MHMSKKQHNVLQRLLTQHATVLICARDGKYFCFCASDPHRAMLNRTVDRNKFYHHWQKRLGSESNSRFTNSQHCQRGMHQNESRAAGINSCNFCCSNGTSSNGEVGTTITLYYIQLDIKTPTSSPSWDEPWSTWDLKLSTLIVPPATPNAPSFGITSNGNSAFSQY